MRPVSDELQLPSCGGENKGSAFTICQRFAVVRTTTVSTFQWL